MVQTQAEIEFSRRFALADLGDEEATLEIAADAGERAALARRFGLVALDTLAATVRLQRVGGGLVRVRASCFADVVQTCVVTLKRVAGRIEDSVEVVFAPPGSAAHGEVTVAPVGDDDPEPLTEDAIDVGEVVAVHLGLALDPYPRRAGAVFSGAHSEAADEDSESSPFAGLRNLAPRG